VTLHIQRTAIALSGHWNCR